MEDRRQRLRAYRRARRKFALIVYVLTIAWMILALIQWIIVALIAEISDIFRASYWISIIFFIVAMLLVILFIFLEKVRFIIGLNWLLTVLIVEFIIIGLFALVSRSPWPDIVMWFFICVLLVFIFVLLGSIIPHDLTLDVVILFVLAFIFLMITIYFIMLYILLEMPYSFLIFQLFVSTIVLLFVMYHAQTINGGRFAEMRLNDHLLASLILFHDFIILFLLSFYAQIIHKFASRYSTTGGETTTQGAPQDSGSGPDSGPSGSDSERGSGDVGG
ncbi:hypothetical protein KR067_012452 [Drosophila pandora]|nr:hypothetical protein KR067_012452 [Drosophila pandora]